MFTKKLKTVLLMGLIFLAVGLVGCDHHHRSRRHRRHIRASRGRSLRHSRVRESSYRDEFSRNTSFNQRDRSKKSRRSRSRLTVKKSRTRSKVSVRKKSSKRRRSHQLSFLKKRRVSNAKKFQKVKARRRLAIAGGNSSGRNYEALLEESDRKKIRRRSGKHRRRK